MFRNACMISLVCCLSPVALGQANFPPGIFFVEDFEDGNLNDNDPVSWRRGVWISGQESVEDGSLVIKNTTGGAYLGPKHPDGNWMGYEDVSIRAQLRITEPRPLTWVALNGRTPDYRSYGVWYETNGMVHLRETQSDGSVVTNQSVQTDLDATTTDIWLRLDTQGDQIRGWAWKAGDPMPEQPFAEFTDNTLTDGSVGIWVEPFGGPASIAIRRFEVLPIPEPSGLVLFAIGVVLLRSRLREKSERTL